VLKLDDADIEYRGYNLQEPEVMMAEVMRRD
jgi:hypothetical protein